MASAKDIVVKPITAQAANALVKRVHYSGKVVPNSQLHFGVYLNGRLEGAMQFGPPMKKRAMIGLVSDTTWNGFIELNRMAFSERLPRNSESRAIAIAMKLIRNHYPSIEWAISFADGTQCGDGAIYRASGFCLTGIKRNSEIRINPRDGKPMATMAAYHKGYAKEISNWQPLVGYQFRYIYFLNPDARQRLTVPILPFSKIDEMGAGMYKGESIKRDTKATTSDQLVGGGAIPTITLHSPYAASKKTNEA